MGWLRLGVEVVGVRKWHIDCNHKNCYWNEIRLTILDADVMLAQLLHSIATNTITSRNVVNWGPRISSQRTVAALGREEMIVLKKNVSGLTKDETERDENKYSNLNEWQSKRVKIVKWRRQTMIERQTKWCRCSEHGSTIPCSRSIADQSRDGWGGVGWSGVLFCHVMSCDVMWCPYV